MKTTLAMLLTVCSLGALTGAPSAEANSSIRADLPYPFGPGGSPDNNAWMQLLPTLTPPASTGLPTTFAPVSVTLVSGSEILMDQANVDVLASNSVQYDAYAAAIPTATYDPGNPQNAPGPVTQILYYTVAGADVLTNDIDNTMALDSSVLAAAGGTEIEFNYDSAQINAANLGPASFTFGGTKYTSASGGNGLLFGADNFVFDSAGKFLGSFVADPISGTTSLVAGVNGAIAGWTSGSSTGTGTGTGTGTMGAPEIDPSSAIAALTLLAGGLVVLSSKSRALKVIR
jgi:hypothetical protein